MLVVSFDREDLCAVVIGRKNNGNYLVIIGGDWDGFIT